MTSLEASVAIFGRWLDLWPGLSSGVAYSTDNNVVPEVVPHARVAIKSVLSQQVTFGPLGKRKWIHTGMIDVRLVGPINAGRDDLDALAQIVKQIYRGVRFGKSARDGGIVTRASSVNEPRRDRDQPQLWILGVVTPFEHYEVA